MIVMIWKGPSLNDNLNLTSEEGGKTWNFCSSFNLAVWSLTQQLKKLSHKHIRTCNLSLWDKTPTLFIPQTVSLSEHILLLKDLAGRFEVVRQEVKVFNKDPRSFRQGRRRLLTLTEFKKQEKVTFRVSGSVFFLFRLCLQRERERERDDRAVNSKNRHRDYGANRFLVDLIKRGNFARVKKKPLECPLLRLSVHLDFHDCYHAWQ
jgi:hypothetical protein